MLTSAAGRTLTPTLQTVRLRHRESKQLALGHTASKQQSPDLHRLQPSGACAANPSGNVGVG